MVVADNLMRTSTFFVKLISDIGNCKYNLMRTSTLFVKFISDIGNCKHTNRRQPSQQIQQYGEVSIIKNKKEIFKTRDN